MQRYCCVLFTSYTDGTRQQMTAVHLHGCYAVPVRLACASPLCAMPYRARFKTMLVHEGPQRIMFTRP